MTQATTQTSELLILDQAAALCGVSPRTLWGWAHNGIAPAPVKIGAGTVRYSRAAYLAWIEGGCKPVSQRGGAGHE
jgi:predicted DNA-binding transcriptional regulator AlpA